MNPPRTRVRRARPLRLVLVLAAALSPCASMAQSSANPFESGTRRMLPPVQPAAIFFPPTPPPLDRPVVRTVMAGSGQLVAPAELAMFVNEPFYAPLSTRLVTKTLSDKQRGALEEYRAAKVALQAELRAELDRLRQAEPDVRGEALEALARRQAPKIAALEKTAEQLRHDFLSAGRGWNDQREWRLSNRERRGFSPIEIAQVMRGYAFYQAGLLPAQRRLLREVALELMMAGDSAENAQANQPYVFFQPELARVSLPEDIPAELAARIAAYQSKKSVLKKELYDAVHAHDGGTLAFLRSPLRPLIEKQAAQFAELERLAEEIRRGLAQAPATARPAGRSPLPPVLMARLGALLRERAQAIHEATAKADATVARAARGNVRVTYRFDDDGLHFVVAPARGGRGRSSPEQTPESLEEFRDEMAAVADEYGRRLAALINEFNGIRRDTAEAIGSNQRNAIDSALTAASRVMLQRQSEDAYRDYRTAVFEPGLSPEQRRLLFDAAVEQLELPLPRGELQPTRRASTW